jgi:LPPG:FO 2-phospho-L-lactate transferase
MQITVLAGGIGGARFLLGLRAAINSAADSVTVIANTADDIWLFGLRICPDLDTIMYTLGGGIDAERSWGRSKETWNASEELAAYGVEPTWFGLGDRDLATHVVRTQMLTAGYPLSAVTEALCERWQPGVRLLPMTDDRVETHVVADDASGSRRAVHFQEYWIRLKAPQAHSVVAVGAEESRPGPGVLEAIAGAEVVVVGPSNPVVSIGTILAVPGIAAAIRTTQAAVVGVSPIIGGAPVRGMADRLLPAIGVEVSARAVAANYGCRQTGGLLDAWLVDESDAADLPALHALGLRARAVPLYLRDDTTSRTLAREVLALAHSAST